jgi:hypothetical protein
MDEPQYIPAVSEPTPPSTASISIPNLAAELNFPTTGIVAGDRGRGTLVLRNTGLAAIGFDSDSVLIGRLSTASKDAVSTDVFYVAGTGIRVQLAYKQELEIPVIFETANRLVESGHIFPGTYFVDVQLPIRSQGQSGALRVVDVPAVEVTVLAPGSEP